MYPCVHVTKARTSSVLYRDSLVAKKIYKIDLVFIIKSFTEASPPPGCETYGYHLVYADSKITKTNSIVRVIEYICVSL